MSGKGSGRRPTEVDEATFQSNWERVFGTIRFTEFKEADYLDSPEAIEAYQKELAVDGARVGANDGSNPSNVGAIPTAPAIRDIGPMATMHTCLVCDEGSIPPCPANCSLSSVAEQRVVNPSVGGSNPSGNAIPSMMTWMELIDWMWNTAAEIDAKKKAGDESIYIDDATGKQVSEAWWPGMPHDAS